jgi:hypothetical protein
MITQEELDLHPSYAMCTVCDRTFTNHTGFDDHRVGPLDDRRCEIPAGHVERDGLWGTPAGHANRHAKAARMAVLRSTQEKSDTRRKSA